MPKEIPTIHDVATRAGVSIATVSRHVSGKRVRNASAIEAAIADLGYRPSPAARNLRSGQTEAVGVVVPDITNPYFAAVVKGAESVIEAEDRRLHLLVASAEENVERERRMLDRLAGNVDGVILGPVTTRAATLDGLRQLEVPVVLLDRDLEHGGSFDAVLVENVGGARQAAEYLTGLGHRRIGLIAGPLDTTPGRGRYDGFRLGLEAAGLGLEDELVEIGDFREASGFDAARRLLSLRPRPTAIFSSNNLMTAGALRALRSLELRIPEEVSVIGFDDLPLGELLDPPLTVVDRPMEPQGEAAMRLLLDRLDGAEAADPQRIVLDAALEVRASCTAPLRDHEVTG